MTSSYAMPRTCCVMLLCLAVSLIIAPASRAKELTLDPGGTPSMALVPSSQRNLKPEDVSVAVWPTTIIDAGRVHHLAQNQPTIMILALANPRGRELARARLVVDLPEGIDLFWTNSYLGYSARTTQDNARQTPGYTHLVMNCTVHPTTFPVIEDGTGNWHSRRRPPALWLMTQLPAGTQPGPAYVRVEYQEKGSAGDDRPWFASPELEVGLQVDAPVQGRQPAIMKTGVMGRFIFNSGGPQPDKAGALHDWLVTLGYNFVIRGVPNAPGNPSLAVWIETHVMNAYTVGGNPPVESAFIVDGKPVPGAVTPAAIYNRDAWVVEHVLKRFEQAAANPAFSWQWTNLEPYAFLKTGCQSERNRDEFIKWSGLDADEVTKAWPAMASAFPEKWKQFQNWQVGQATRVVAETIAKAAADHGRDARLIFSTAQDALAGGEADFSLDILAWGDMPAAAQTWSYHATPNAGYPANQPRFASSLIGRASWLRFTADNRLSQGREERFSLIYGWDQTRGGPFYLPEHLGFNQLSVILAGSDIVHNYAEWPVWDARYAAAIAEANTRIATWEAFITRGQRKRAHVMLPLPPYPQVWPEDVTPAQQDIENDVDMPNHLFSYEYQHEGKRLIAVANTWVHGDCIARLRIPGLEAQARYLLSEPEQNRLLTSADARRPWVTGQELDEGLLVHVGAIRWACFLLEPYHDGQAMASHERVTSADMQQAVADWTRRLNEQDIARRTVFKEQFSELPLGPTGEGKHGEQIPGSQLRIGYPPKADLTQANVQIVERRDQQPGREVLLTDSSSTHQVYLAATVNQARAELTCTITPETDGPFRVTLGAYIAELLLPSEEEWGKWFNTPYQPRLVYMQGDVDAPGKHVTPIDTGFEVKPGQSFKLRWMWADAKSTLWIDGRMVVDQKTFKVPNLAVTQVVWGTQYPLGPSGQPARLRLADIQIVKLPE